KKDGTQMDGLITTKLILYEGEQAILGIVTDISEHIKVEKALRESEERYRNLIENSPVAIFVQCEGKVVFANSETKRVMGAKSNNQLIGTEVLDYVHPDFKQTTLDRIKMVHAQKTRANLIEEKFIRLDGKIIDVEVMGTPVLYQGKSAIQVVFRDITEHKKAEKSLNESLAMLRAITNTAEDSIFIKDKDRKYIFFNPAAEKLLALPLSRLLGKTPEEVFDKVSAAEVDRRNFAGETVDTVRTIKVAGKECTLHTIQVPLRNDSGEITGICGIVRDVTEKKMAENALKESEAFNKTIIFSVNQGVIVYDRYFNYRVWNKRMEQMTGLASEKVVGRNAFDVFPHLKTQGVDKLLRKALRGANVVSSDIPFYVPETGKKGWVVGAYSPHIGANGDILGVTAIITDITLRKEMEETIRNSEERFRTIFEQATDAIVLIDAETCAIVQFNRRACEQYGYTEKEFGRLSIMDFKIEESEEQVKKHVQEVICAGQETFETRHRHKNGSILNIMVKTRSLILAGKSYLLATWRNITEEKQAEEIKNNLIRNVSHGLKSPIAISEMAFNMCGQCLDKGDIEQAKEVQRIAFSNLQKLRTDIGKMLELYTLDVRKIKAEKIKTKAISVKKVMNETIEALKQLALKKGVLVKLVAKGNIPKVKMEYRDLRILFGNALENALKFTKKGSVTVSLENKNKHICITVKDTGCGVALKNQSMVFKRFSKEFSVTEGAGLGLTICKEIVDLYHGSISLISPGVGKGTCVIIRIPLR
ncbi:MAG: PAS domain S-box protein, partial [Chlamydiota bacterium]|nr:PAS domain S-box protein [Chlamydiota bacterium]